MPSAHYTERSVQLLARIAVTDPPGGFILWLELPSGIDSLALYQLALRHNICIAPGTMFSATDRFRHCIRLGVGGRWDDAQRDGLKQVGALAHQLLPASAGRAPGAGAPALPIAFAE